MMFRPRLVLSLRRLARSHVLSNRPYSTSHERSGVSGALLKYAAVLAAGTAIGTFVAGRNTQNGSREDKSITSIADIGPIIYGSPEKRQEAYNKVTSLVGKENVTDLKDELAAHSDTYWSTHRAKSSERPGIVVFPESTAQVSEILKIAHKYRVPVIPFSGGTSLEGHFIPTHGGICLDFKRMNAILAVHKGDLDAVVQPGVGWESLNEHLAEMDLFFGPDPGPGAEIGGMIGTSCSGTNAARYGTMKDNVLSLTVVLADGSIIKTKQRPRKSSAGYNLNGVFVGSEGTLGIVTEATLKLVPKPQNESVSVASFKTLYQAAEVVQEVIQRGIQVGCVELMDEEMMKAINNAKATDRIWNEAPSLFFKFNGTKLSVEDQIKSVRNISKAHGLQTFDFAKDAEECELLWSARKNALWSTIDCAPKGHADVWTTDVCVPVSNLANIIDETKKDVKESGLYGTILGHVADGNFHAIIMYDHEKEIEIVEGVVNRMVDRALAVEGTCTGEHGVGLGKKDFLVSELGQPAVDTMRSLKKALDPRMILNPDKVISIF